MAGSTPSEDVDLMKVLGVLTGDLLPVKQTNVTDIYGTQVTGEGRYYLEEADLPQHLSFLLHGRAYVVDKDTITEISAFSPRTYYVSADKSNGLIVPGRAMSIVAEAGSHYVSGDAHFRWTDDGEKWTNWVTMPIGKSFSFLPQELVRFGEIQVYSDSGNIDMSIIVTR